MDRSFLSRPEVVAASRKFVSVRLLTYEDEAEGKLLKSLAPTRSGELENTVFTVLSPDGKRRLARGSRSARQTFGDAARMAEALERIAREHGARAPAADRAPELPAVPGVRLAVNVAACDGLPLAVLFTPAGEPGRALERRLAELAWGGEFLGRFIYARASGAKDLAPIEGARAEAGLLVVQPDAFGLKGKVLRQAGASASLEELARCLREGAALYRGEEKSFAGHVRGGREKGAFWEAAIPVTDPMERRARQRSRRE
jgi:hypothetical protein